MGSSFASLHIRSNDTNAVRKAFEQTAAAQPVFVSKAEKNWVSAYSHPIDSQDESLMRSICEQLSESLKTGVFGLIVHDSDILIYVLAENGTVVDQYNSWPGYFEGNDTPPSGGDVQHLLKYCVQGTAAESLDSVLRSGGKGLPGGMSEMMGGVGAIKKQLVKSSPWWAKPVVWTAMSLMEAKSKKGGTTATAPALDPGMTDAVWRGDRMASALAKLLGIAEDRAKACYAHIEDGSASISRRSFTLVGDEMVEQYDGPTPEQEALASSSIQEMIAPLSQRPSWPQFLTLCKEILNAPAEQESFKRVCVANGLRFEQKKMNMMGLGPSPAWWTFTFEADQMSRRKFGFTAIPQKGLVQCAMHELCSFPQADNPGAASPDAEFDYAVHVAQQVLGAPEISGRDDGNHKYSAWRGQSAYLFIFQSPAADLSPFPTLDLWWEVWQQPDTPAISGNTTDWLQKRHPTLF